MDLGDSQPLHQQPPVHNQPPVNNQPLPLHHQQPPFHHQYHQQQPPSFHHQQPLSQHHQQPQPSPQQLMMMASPLSSFSPQFPNHSGNIASNNADLMQQQNARFQFNSVPQKPLESLNSLNSQFTDGSSPSAGFRAVGYSTDSPKKTESPKKKRGRPRKYSPDGNNALGLSSSTVAPVVNHGNSGGVGGGTVVQDSEPASKKARGRPAGSGKKQLDTLGVPGVGFTPHVIAVDAGEDIASKIMAFSQEGPRTVCILSANGAISNVTLHQAATSTGTVSYEGRFEIISLSGSVSLSDNNGDQSRLGSLSVSLAGTDGRVLGGVVAGELKAATRVQVIVGSFIADVKKPKPGLPPTSPHTMLNVNPAVPGISPPCGGGSSESSDDNGSSSPVNTGPGPYVSASQPTTPMYSNISWANSTMNKLPN